MTPPDAPARRPARRHRGASSAASQAGIIGLPDPGAGPRHHDGGLRAFCVQFNRRFDALAETRRPEFRTARRNLLP